MREMRIFNGTPHPISVIDDSCITFKNEIRKYVCTGKPVIVAQIPSNGVLSAKIDTVEAGLIGNIPIFEKKDCRMRSDPRGVRHHCCISVVCYRGQNGGSRHLLAVHHRRPGVQ